MNFDKLRQFMERLTEWRIPGNSIKVTIENKEVFSFQSGYEDIKNKIPMRENLLFNVYSCSKPITVIAALQLYEKGFFLLDDPLYDFIPEYRNMYINKSNGEKIKVEKTITLRHLFTMTSGLTYNSGTQAFEEARIRTNGHMNTLETIKCLAKDGLSFEPGENWQYSLSHDVLAAVVEVVSGKKFRDYVKENIFSPLGMNNSFYHNDAVRDRVAKQYSYINSDEPDIVKKQSSDVLDSPTGIVKEIEKSVRSVYGDEYDSGGAGVTTSVEDYSLFSSALANGGKGANGEQIISKNTILLMRENQLSKAQLQNFCWSQLKGYGYGLGVRTLIDKTASGSNGNLKEFGWGGAAGATVLVDTDLKLSMFYTHHMLNPQEEYYQPRLRNVLYSCLD